MGEKIETRCPHCGAGFQVKAEALGRRVKCPKCSEVFLVEARQEGVPG